MHRVWLLLLQNAKLARTLGKASQLASAVIIAIFVLSFGHGKVKKFWGRSHGPETISVPPSTCFTSAVRTYVRTETVAASVTWYK